MKILLSLSRWLARYTSLFIILIAIVAFFVPDAFASLKDHPAQRFHDASIKTRTFPLAS